MCALPKCVIKALFCGLVLCAASAWAAPGFGQAADAVARVRQTGKKSALNAEDRSSILKAAFEWHKTRGSGHDCSHMVHDIYSRAGFPYQYADSDDLYAGAEGFQRVSHPRAADLVVWHGHAGIIVHPSRHTFFSLLSNGPGINDYKSRYWKGRGRPRFYRYIKSASCAGCTLARN